MGCGSSTAAVRPAPLDASSLTYVRPPAHEGAPAFELSTPMLCMPFRTFKAQRRIFKSTKPWRDTALADGSLLAFAKLEGGVGTGKVADGKLDGTIVVAEGLVSIFISHTWWDRAFVDKTNDPSNPYDKGAPDWQSGKKKNLKHRVICAGVERLIEEKGLDPAKVVVWCDWQSIYQVTACTALRRAIVMIM